MTEIIFLVEEAIEGGYTAHALGASIMTEADDLATLPQQVRDAVTCHFDEKTLPKYIKIESSDLKGKRSRAIVL